MIVIVLSKCPAKVKGDLSKWLYEISPGVFAGKVSQRVRERLWLRIRENIEDGRATMVYSSKNEQGLEFRVCGTPWYPRDFDGLTFMCRPSTSKTQNSSIQQNAKPGSVYPDHPPNPDTPDKKISAPFPSIYVAVDIETTGLDPQESEIIEIGALLVNNRQVMDEFSCLISRSDNFVPEEIQELTGITKDILDTEGIPLTDALYGFMKFIQDYALVGHSLEFDLSFLNVAFAEFDYKISSRVLIDTLQLARTKLRIPGYSLDKVCQHFKVVRDQPHRALSDAKDVYKIFEELKKI